MLQVALLGRLAKKLDAFQSHSLQSDVQWRILPMNEEELARLDLLVYLPDDADAISERTLGGTAALLSRYAACWTTIPPAAALDEMVQASLSEVYGFVVGYTPAMHVVCRWIRSLAHPVASVLRLCTLIVGESGTGKELVARAIHRLGDHRKQRFVPLNCASVPRELAPSVFFGHVKGAFTGATADRQGYLQEAGEGVLFLDEIGELALELQAHLLRVLDQRTFSPVGSSQTLSLDAQLVSATNRDLDRDVKQGRFRADLFFRIAQMTMFLPPLRERMIDLPLLAKTFLGQLQGAEQIDPATMDEIAAYSWPGNIRQLRSFLERWVVLRQVGERPSLAEWLHTAEQPTTTSVAQGTLPELREAFDRRILTEVLARTGGDTKKAAQELGISRRSVYNLAHRYGVAVKPPEKD